LASEEETAILKISITSALMAGLVGLLALVAAAVYAQAAGATLPAHYKLELENQYVRVLHITVEPHSKVAVHELNDAVVVPLVDYESTLKTANGGSVIVERKIGKAAWLPGGKREIETGAKGVDALVIEIKRAAPAR
jgi:hypothetical protein